MTAFEIYALFGGPVLLFLVALVVFWLTGIDDARDKEHHPAE
jgi:hypothetical protein